MSRSTITIAELRSSRIDIAHVVKSVAISRSLETFVRFVSVRWAVKTNWFSQIEIFYPPQNLIDWAWWASSLILFKTSACSTLFQLPRSRWVGPPHPSVEAQLPGRRPVSLSRGRSHTCSSWPYVPKNNQAAAPAPTGYKSHKSNYNLSRPCASATCNICQDGGESNTNCKLLTLCLKIWL